MTSEAERPAAVMGLPVEAAPRGFLWVVLLLVPLLPLPSFFALLGRDPSSAWAAVPPIDLDLPKWAISGALLGLLGAFLMARAAVRRAIAPLKVPQSLAWLGALVAWQALSCLWAMNASIAVAATFRTFLLFLVASLAVNVCEDAGQLRRLATALALAAAAISSYGLHQRAGIDFPSHSGGARRLAVSTLGNENFASEWLVATLPLVLGLALSASTWPGRIGFAAVALLQATHLPLTHTRAGVLALGAAAGLAIADHLRARVHKMAALLLLAGLLLGGIAFLYSQSESASARVRREIYPATLRLALDHPALGVGAGNFPIAFPPYRTAEEVALSGLASHVEDAHDEYLQSFAELGIPGLFLLVLFGISALSEASRASRRGADPHVKRFALGAGMAVAAVLVNALLRSPLHNPAAALAFALSVGISAKLGAGRVYVVQKATRLTLIGPGILFLLIVPYAVQPLVADRSFRNALAAEQEAEAEAEAAARARRGGLPEEARSADERARQALARAASLLAQACEVGRDRYDYRFRLARILHHLGRAEDARARLREALSLHPNFVEARIDLGASYGREGKLEEAEKELRAAAALGPPRPDTLQNLGLIYARQGKKDLAREALERALKLAPGNAAIEAEIRKLDGG